MVPGRARVRVRRAVPRQADARRARQGLHPAAQRAARGQRTVRGGDHEPDRLQGAHPRLPETRRCCEPVHCAHRILQRARVSAFDICKDDATCCRHWCGGCRACDDAACRVQQQGGTPPAPFKPQASPWPQRKLATDTTYGALHGKKEAPAAGTLSYGATRGRATDLIDYGFEGKATHQVRPSRTGLVPSPAACACCSLRLRLASRAFCSSCLLQSWCQVGVNLSDCRIESVCTALRTSTAMWARAGGVCCVAGRARGRARARPSHHLPPAPL
jgi:hypothetical protein